MISPSRGLFLIQKGRDVTRTANGQLTALLSPRAWRPRVRAVARRILTSERSGSVHEPHGVMRLPSVGFTRRSRSNQSRAPLAFRRNRLNLRRAQRNVVGYRKLDDSFKDFKTGPAISPISWFDAKQPRPREWGGEAHERNEMECCRRAGDRSFSLRLSVRDSAPSGPGHRGDLPDTFGQLSYLKLTSSKFHLLLPRIGDRHSGRHLGTLSGVGWQIVDLQQISQNSVESIIMHATVCAVTRRRFPVGTSPTRRFAPPPL